MIGVKLFTVAAYILGATGLCLMSWPIILITVFIIGVQATIFSPAIYGSIPELYPAEYVVRANGIFNAAANTAILAGIAGAGIVLDIKGSGDKISLGVHLMAGICIILAVAGFIASTLVPKFPAASPKAKFPRRGPFESVAALLGTREDSLLAKSIFAKAFFWFTGSLQVLIINAMVLSQFKQTMTMTSVMVGIELIGIGAGSILSPIFAKGERWYRGLVPSALLMAGAMFAVAAIPYLPAQACKPVVVCALVLIGIGGGIFCIPVTSFVQVRPAAEIKGKMIAASNLADFTGILLAGAVYFVVDQLHIKPSSCFALEGLIVMVMVVWLITALPKGSENA